MKIAVFITRRDYEVVYSLLRGIHERARQDNVDVVVFWTGETNNMHTPNIIGEYQIFGLPQLTDYDGAIVATQQILFKEILDPLTKQILKSGIPAVSIGRKVEGMMSVDIDNYESMSKMIEHIMSTYQPQKILYVMGLDNEENRLQQQAVRDILKKYGKELPDESILRGLYDYRAGFIAAGNLYEKCGKNGLPDVIICNYDVVAHGIMDYFLYKTDDVKIPEDMLIVGYNKDRDGKLLLGSASLAEKYQRTIGYTACDMILDTTNQKTKSADRTKGKKVSPTPLHDKKDEKGELRRMLEKKYTYNLRNNAFQIILEEASGNLRSSSDHQEFMNRLKEEISSMQVEGFYMMLEENLDEIDGRKHLSSSRTIPYILKVPIIWKKGEVTSLEEFKSKDFLPAYEETHGDLYLAFTLHYQDKVKGYCVIQNPWYMLENDFVMNFARGLNTSMEICSQRIRLVKVNERLNKLYIQDSLTGLLNRFGYEKEVGSLFQKNAMEKKVSMVAFVDIDRLKYINDTFGHEFGDIAILSATGIIKRVFPSHFVKVRLGGDEFVLFGECADEELAESYITTLKKEFAKSEGWTVLPFDIGASIGYVLTDPNNDCTLASYVEQADQKMYAEKMRRKELRKQALGEKSLGLDERMI